jgi:hypothetical protein
MKLVRYDGKAESVVAAFAVIHGLCPMPAAHPCDDTFGLVFPKIESDHNAVRPDQFDGLKGHVATGLSVQLLPSFR